MVRYPASRNRAGRVYSRGLSPSGSAGKSTWLMPMRGGRHPVISPAREGEQTGGCGVAIGKEHTLLRQRIQKRSAVDPAAVAPEIPVSHIIAVDQDHMRGPFGHDACAPPCFLFVYSFILPGAPGSVNKKAAPWGGMQAVAHFLWRLALMRLRYLCLDILARRFFLMEPTFVLLGGWVG